MVVQENADRRPTADAVPLRTILRALGIGENQIGEVVGADAPADLAAAIGAVRGSVAAGFGLTAEQRIARVLAGAGLTPAEAAAAMALDHVAWEDLADRAARGLEAGSARRAVILEDQWLCRQDLERFCAGRAIEVVASGADPAVAVLAAAAYLPGIALLDLNIHGDELSGEIAAMQICERLPDCRVILVTGYPMADRLAALIPNSHAVIKPIRAEALEKAVAAALG